MKKAKRVVALLLAVLVFCTSDSYLYQVLAEEAPTEETTPGETEGKVDGSTDQTGNTQGGNEGGGTDTKESESTEGEVKSVDNENPTQQNVPNTTEDTSVQPAALAGVQSEPGQSPSNPISVPMDALVGKGAASGGFEGLKSEATLLSGERFVYSVMYNVADPGGEHSGKVPLDDVLFEILIPSNLEVEEQVLGSRKSLATGTGVVQAVLSPYGTDGKYNLLQVVFEAGQTTGAGKNVTIILKTKNFETPNGTVIKDGNNDTLKLDSTLTYKINDLYYKGEVKQAPQVTINAKDDWSITKSVEGKRVDTYQSDKYNGGVFVGSYTVAVKNSKNIIDVPGHLRADNVSIIDTLPTDYLTNGEPIEIKNVRMSHGSDMETMQPEDYKVVYNDKDVPVGIEFYNWDKTTETGSELTPANMMKDTTYTYDVVYKAKPYLSDASVGEAKKYNLKNNVELKYTLVGEGVTTKNADATLVVSGYDTDVAQTEVELQKYLQFAGEEFLVDSSTAKAYGVSKVGFIVYNEDGQTRATNALDPTVRIDEAIIGSDGNVKISGLVAGKTYVLKEQLPDDSPLDKVEDIKFTTPAKAGDPIVIISPTGNNANVSVETNSDGSTYIKVVNPITSRNKVTFSKMGINSSGEKVILWDSVIKGVGFTLTDISVTDSNYATSKKYYAYSDEKGKVLFSDIPNGSYKLWEASNPFTEYGFKDAFPIGTVVVSGGTIAKPLFYPEQDAEDNVFYNHSVVGSVEIQKYNKDKSLKLPGAEFTLYKPQNQQITQGEVNALSDEEFKDLEKEKSIANVEMDTNGYVKYTDIKPGVYILEETKVPTGYKKDTDNKGRIVFEVKARENKRVEVTNIQLQSLRFKKTGKLNGDDVNGTAYFKGIEFKVYTAATDGDLIGTVAINVDENGVAVSSESVYLEPNTNYYYEEKVPSESLFKAKTGRTLFNLSQMEADNGIYWITVENESNAGKIKIIKEDAENGANKLGGAKFEVKKNDQSKGSYTTSSEANEIGTCITGYLPVGEYTVTETEAPSGYALNNKTQTVKVTADGLAEVTFTNKKEYKLEIIKVDQGGNPISNSGAKFSIKKNDGTAETKEADAGTIVYEDVVKGDKFTIQETDVNAAYEMLKNQIEITIGDENVDSSDYSSKFENGVQTVKIINKKKAKITVNKKHNFDQATPNTYVPYTGSVTFDVYTKNADGSGHTKLGESITVSAGSGSIENLPLGVDYYLVEQEVEGYELGAVTIGSDQVTEFVTIDGKKAFIIPKGKVEAGAEISVVVNNTATKGRLQIKKVLVNKVVDKDGKVKDGMPSNLEGVKFDLYIKKSGEWSQINDPSKPYLTDENGEISSSEFGYLEEGDYKLVERLENNRVPHEGEERGEYDSVKKTLSFEVTIEAGKTNKMYFDPPIKNSQKGSLYIHKYGSFEGLEEDLKIIGATYNIYKENPDENPDAVPVLPAVTNTKNVWEIEVKDLEPGEYWVKEIYAPGDSEEITSGDYKKDDVAKKVVVVSGLTTSTTGNTAKIVNEADQLSMVTILKTDLNDEPITTSAVFEIYVELTPKEDGNPPDGFDTNKDKYKTITRGNEVIYLERLDIGQSTSYPEGNTQENIGTGPNGVGYTIPSRLAGKKIWIREKTPPKDYEIIEEWHGDYKVEAGGTLNVTVANKPEEGEGPGVNYDKRLFVNKFIFGTSTAVDGVKYFVYKADADGNYVDGSPIVASGFTRSYTEAELGNVLSGKLKDKGGSVNGLFITQELPPGKYIIREANANEYFGSEKVPELVDISESFDKQGEKIINNYISVTISEDGEITYGSFYNKSTSGHFVLKKEVVNAKNDNTTAFGFKLYRAPYKDGDVISQISKWEFVEEFSVKAGETKLSKLLSKDYAYKLEENDLVYTNNYYFEEQGNNTKVRYFTIGADEYTGFAGNGYVKYDNITDAQNNPILYTNRIKPVLKLTKEAYGVTADGKIEQLTKDAEDKKLDLSGVKFALYKDDGYLTEYTVEEYKDILFGKTKAVLTTNSAGVLSIKIKAGTYYLKEISVNDSLKELGITVPDGGIKLGKITVNVNGTISFENYDNQTLLSGETTDIKVRNESQYGRFKALKVNGNKESAESPYVGLADVQFDLYKEGDTSKSMTITSDANGVITTPLLSDGKYYLKEVEAPSGYIMDPTKEKNWYGPYEVKSSGSVESYITEDELIIKNFLTFDIKVLKHTNDAKKTPLKGAEFKLYSKYDGTQADEEARYSDYIASGSTTGNGELVFSNSKLNLAGVAPGETKTFYLRETKAPEGYVRSTTPISVEVTYDKIKAGNVTITVEVSNNEGPALKIKKVGNLNYENGRDDTNGLKGVSFDFYKVTVENDSLKYTKLDDDPKYYVTNDNGEIDINREKKGVILENDAWYAVVETGVPAPYQANFTYDEDNKKYYYLQAKDAKTTTTLYPSVKVEDGKIVATDEAPLDKITNNATTVRLEVIKTDGSSQLLKDDKVLTPLENANFAIYKKDNGEYKLYTSENFPNADTPEYGCFNVNEHGYKSSFYLAYGDYMLKELTFDMKDKDSTEQAIKDYINARAAAGEVADDFNPYGKVVISGTEHTVRFRANTSGEAGKFTINSENSVGTAGSKVFTKHMFNDPLGEITVIKYGDLDNDSSTMSESELLSGVEFKLSGDEISSRTAETKGGKIVYKELPSGDYSLEETKTVDGFKELSPNPAIISNLGMVDGRPITLNELAANGEESLNILFKKVSLENKSAYGLLRVKKVDEDGKLLDIPQGESITFDVYKSNNGKLGDKLEKQIVLNKGNNNEAGVFYDGWLEADESGTTYFVKERNTIKNYVYDDEPCEVTVFPIRSQDTIISTNKNTAVITNKKAELLTENDIAITKAVKTADTDYDSTVHIEDNLHTYKANPKDGNVTVDFRVSNYAEGKNKYPLSNFTVTDGLVKDVGSTGIALLDAVTGGNEIDLTSDENDIIKDYRINSLNLKKSTNADTDKKVSAKVYAMYTKSDYNNADPDGYSLVEEDIDLSKDYMITFDKAVIAIKIVYENTDIGFTSGGYEMKTTFNYRGNWSQEELKSKSLVMAARNTAYVSFNEVLQTGIDENGNPQYSGDSDYGLSKPSNEAMVIFDDVQYDRPQVSIRNEILGDKTVFYSGDEIRFKIHTKNEPRLDGKVVDLLDPVITFRMPLDTILTIKDENDHNLAVQLNTYDPVTGKVTKSESLKEGIHYFVMPVQNVSPVTGIDEDGKYKYDSRTVTQYNLIFNVEGEKVKVGVNQGITVEFKGEISNDTKQDFDQLYLISSLGSTHTPSVSSKNPYGTSWDGTSKNNPKKYDEDSSKGTSKQLEFIDCFDSAGVTNSTQMLSSKYVSTSYEEGEVLPANRNVVVEPGEDIYYQISVSKFNDEKLDNTKMDAARFIDVLPYNNDKMLLGNSSRGSTIPEASSLELDEMKLIDVYADKMTKGKVEVDKAQVYYYVEKDSFTNSWSNGITAADKEADGRMGMVYHIDSDWKGGWQKKEDCVGIDLRRISAVGVDVKFKEPMSSGDSYSVTFKMQAPNVQSSQIELYKDKLMVNSVVSALVPSEDSRGNRTELLENERVEPSVATAKLKLPKGEIGDYLWYDDNGNGKQDKDEQSLGEGVTVSLRGRRYYYLSPTDKILRKQELTVVETKTDSEGKYYFKDLNTNALKATEAAKPEKLYSQDPKDYVDNEYYVYWIEVDYQGRNLTPTLQQVDRKSDTDEFHYLNVTKSNSDSDINSAGRSPEIMLMTKNLGYKLEGEKRLDIDGGFVQSFAIGDRVWEDYNADGIQDVGEPGIEDVFVYLYQVSDTGEYDETSPYRTTRTNSEGKYEFTGLRAGKYVVGFDATRLLKEVTNDPTVEKPYQTYKYAFTTEKVRSHDKDSDALLDSKEPLSRKRYTEVIELSRAKTIEEAGKADGYDDRWDAGLVEYSSLGGYVFDDRDYDDLQKVDAKFTPLEGVKVSLYEKGNSNAIASQIVDGNGRYFFDSLLVGKDGKEYQVKFELPDKSRYQFVAPNADPNENPTGTSQPSEDSYYDSDAVVYPLNDAKSKVAMINSISLKPGETSKTWCAGARLTSNVGNYIWMDANHDGYQDDSEKGVGDIPVYLQRRSSESEAWETIDSTKTSSSVNNPGFYGFDGVQSSDEVDYEYRIVFGFDRNDVITEANVISRFDDLSNSYVPVSRDQDSDAQGVYLDGLHGGAAGYATAPFKPSYGEEDLTWDAGVTPVLSNIKGKTWYDANFDGIFDDKEDFVIGGVRVCLQRNNSGLLGLESAWIDVPGRSMVTEEDGLYEFNDLDPGYYRLKFTLPAGYKATQYNNANGVSDGVYRDSDAARRSQDEELTYYSMEFYLEPNDTVDYIDAGIYEPGTEERFVRRTIPQKRYLTRSRTRTGDETRAILWLVMIVVSALVLLVFGRKKYKKSKKK
ncbi:archaellum component FlaF (FlaF/FlaG flagellin family) [Lachnospiraceae bacterium PFB1-21]